MTRPTLGLRVRLVLALGAAAALASLLVAWAAYASASSRLRGDLDRDVTEQAVILTAALDRAGPGGTVRLPLGPDRSIRLPGAANARHDVARPLAARFGAVQLIDATGSVVEVTGTLSSARLPVDDTDRSLATSELSPSTGSPIRLRDATVDGTPIRLATAPLAAGGAVQAAVDAGPVRASLQALGLRYGAIGLLATVAAMTGGLLVARRLARPIERLAEATTLAATTGDLAAPIEVARGVSGADEVGRLAASFSTLLGALASSRDTQRQLVQDAGHELRTPLTSVRTNLEVLRRHSDLDPETRAHILADVEAEVGELSSLVEELVQLAAGDEPARGEPADVAFDDLVHAQVDRAFRRTGRAVLVAVLEPTTIHGEAADLERAVANLLDNALKFSPATSPVEVRLAGRELVVADHGPGVAPHDREAVFERFHRSAEARAVPGSGLGLAIVAQVAAAHGARAWVTDRSDATPGAAFHLAFPIPAARL